MHFVVLPKLFIKRLIDSKIIMAKILGTVLRLIHFYSHLLIFSVSQKSWYHFKVLCFKWKLFFSISYIHPKIMFNHFAINLFKIWKLYYERWYNVSRCVPVNTFLISQPVLLFNIGLSSSHPISASRVSTFTLYTSLLNIIRNIIKGLTLLGAEILVAT